MNLQNPNQLDFKKKFFSDKFNSFFIFEFTKHLIFNSAPLEVLKLKERILEENQRIGKEENPPKEEKFVEEPPLEIEKPKREEIIEEKKLSFSGRKTPTNIPSEARLYIPKTTLPQELSYLKPTATNTQIDLGKLNPFLNDPLVKTIECPGEGQNVLVRGVIGHKKTAIVFTEDEIKKIIEKFSEESKIPLHEGTFKVAVGRFILMAIYSEVVGSKFMIQKISPFSQ
jgi:hypothetical protein